MERNQNTGAFVKPIVVVNEQPVSIDPHETTSPMITYQPQNEMWTQNLVSSTAIPEELLEFIETKGHDALSKKEREEVEAYVQKNQGLNTAKVEAFQEATEHFNPKATRAPEKSVVPPAFYPHFNDKMELASKLNMREGDRKASLVAMFGQRIPDPDEWQDKFVDAAHSVNIISNQLHLKLLRLDSNTFQRLLSDNENLLSETQVVAMLNTPPGRHRLGPGSVGITSLGRILLLHTEDSFSESVDAGWELVDGCYSDRATSTSLDIKVERTASSWVYSLDPEQIIDFHFDMVDRTEITAFANHRSSQRKGCRSCCLSFLSCFRCFRCGCFQGCREGCCGGCFSCWRECFSCCRSTHESESKKASYSWNGKDYNELITSTDEVSMVVNEDNDKQARRHVQTQVHAGFITYADPSSQSIRELVLVLHPGEDVFQLLRVMRTLKKKLPENLSKFERHTELSLNEQLLMKAKQGSLSESISKVTKAFGFKNCLKKKRKKARRKVPSTKGSFKIVLLLMLVVLAGVAVGVWQIMKSSSSESESEGSAPPPSMAYRR